MSGEIALSDGAIEFQGSLFALDFLTDAIVRLPEWVAVDDNAIARLREDLAAIFATFPTDLTPNESQTEDDLIWLVLERLGWTALLRQQNLATRGRDDVPDGLLFESDAHKTEANAHAEEWRRYGFGRAIVESKRWQRPLDRRSGRRGEETAPSTQMLRYLRRVEDLTTGNLRWGILTNGGRWRLYYQGARSVSEQFFEVDLAAILGIEGHDGGLFALNDEARTHWLRVFLLVFGRDAFVPSPSDSRTFHQRALDEGRFYEQRVAESLSQLVFEQLFPHLTTAIANEAPDAELQEVRDAALVLLYRLLFLLYAEDRDLLPVRDSRYDNYSLRDRVRGEIGQRKDDGDVFSTSAGQYWAVIDDLCRAIDAGDASIGLPPYNGGLFDRQRTPLLAHIRLNDAIVADVIDRLSFEETPQGRKYINYRDLSVQQLGSIYERLLEHEVYREDGEIIVRPNKFARKGSGSYYTPDDLVQLILKETLEPLIAERFSAFQDRTGELGESRDSEGHRLGLLKRHDPAERLLELRICDPAMGSGHFLVSLVDIMADHVITAMAEAESTVDWGEYVSPLADRVETIRNTILHNAEEMGWTIDASQLDDRHIVRRMVLKRCVYGVDKNPMAVELAKVSLWLHTFTVGAPLSFLDHHLRCGDSLFGSWVRPAMDRVHELGGELLLHEPMRRAMRAASAMQVIESLTDAEIAEAHRSKDIFDEVREMTEPLDAFLSLLHALDWVGLRSAEDRAAIQAFLDGQFGDPIEIAKGALEASSGNRHAAHFASILSTARTLIAEEKFLNWQAVFPGVWSSWEGAELSGGFDAVVGNPPWDRVKLQQVEWFEARCREIALATRAADRKRMIEELVASEDPLARDYARANQRAENGARMARACGDYPLLASGDVNLYSLFVERAMMIVKRQGIVGLLTPSGIASDKTASKFFKGVATEGRLKALYDFENGRQGTGYSPFFADVHRSFKFCVLVASPSPTPSPAQCAFFLHDVSELDDPERCFELTAENFASVNPNTGTAPIFRSRRAAALTTAVYGRLPVLVDRSSGEEVSAWPVKYSTMFHMTNDSHLFRTRAELDEREGAWPIGGSRFGSASGEWVPLYVGRMIHQFDHRAASVEVNVGNVHNAALSGDVTLEQKADPTFAPTPQYWVSANEVRIPGGFEWAIAFRDIARATDARTMIASLVPIAGFGNTAPILVSANRSELYRTHAPLLLANLNARILDFVVRQKAQSTHLNWYIAEQLPIVHPESYAAVHFGGRYAGEIVRAAVLELTYTAHDMAPFARDTGHVDGENNVLAPFVWDEERRLKLRAKLDAVYFHLYGVTDREDVRYVYSTFPIIERDEMDRFDSYRSRELCLAWMNALAAGEPDTEIDL